MKLLVSCFIREQDEWFSFTCLGATFFANEIINLIHKQLTIYNDGRSHWEFRSITETDQVNGQLIIEKVMPREPLTMGSGR